MNKTPYPCTCNGCRRQLPQVSRAYYQGEWYLNSVVEGHFFSPDTMRWFKSRISQIALLKEPGLEDIDDSGLAVIVSNKRESDSPREYELVRICKWGYITRDYDNYTVMHYNTLRQARKALESAEYPTACACHGCSLDLSEAMQVI